MRVYYLYPQIPDDICDPSSDNKQRHNSYSTYTCSPSSSHIARWATKEEKVYVIAGPEFREKERHIFVINKALYGLKTSGKRWH